MITKLSDEVAEVAAEAQPAEPPPGPAPKAKPPAKRKFTGNRKVPKKTAPKPAAKAKAKPQPAAKAKAPRAELPEDAVIKWLAEANPARQGGARWERVEKLRKAAGKTVAAALKIGVPAHTIRNSLRLGLIKLA
jgi:hypothetical protein